MLGGQLRWQHEDNKLKCEGAKYSNTKSLRIRVNNLTHIFMNNSFQTISIKQTSNSPLMHLEMDNSLTNAYSRYSMLR